MAINVEDPVLLTQDAAAYLGVHVKTLVKLARTRQIDVVRLAPGGPLRFRRSVLNRYLDQHSTKARQTF